MIDDIRIYDAALMQEEIAALAQWASSQGNRTPNVAKGLADCGAAGTSIFA